MLGDIIVLDLSSLDTSLGMALRIRRRKRSQSIRGKILEVKDNLLLLS